MIESGIACDILWGMSCVNLEDVLLPLQADEDTVRMMGFVVRLVLPSSSCASPW